MDKTLTIKDRERKFVEELTLLSIKYNIIVTGCGDCGSPTLSDLTTKDPWYGAGDLRWAPGLKRYKWDET